MTDFEQAWRVCDSIPGSFTRINALALWNAATTVTGGFLEIGVDQGRSASLLLHAARQTGSHVILVDSWESILIDNYYKVLGLVRAFPDVNVTILQKTSAQAHEVIGLPDLSFGLVHIDANHYEGHPDEDCVLWLPHLRSGGLVCFHDYESTFPAVTEAVNHHTDGWEVIGNFESLAIRRKP